MVALPVIPINADSGFDGPIVKTHRYTSTVVAACLLLLLAFSTATAFVHGCLGASVLPDRHICPSGGLSRHQGLAGAGADCRRPGIWFVYLIPVWGMIQIFAHTTSSSFETRKEVLRWGALAGVFFLTQGGRSNPHGAAEYPERISDLRNCDGGALPTGLFTSGGKVLWIFPSGYPMSSRHSFPPTAIRNSWSWLCPSPSGGRCEKAGVRGGM